MSTSNLGWIDLGLKEYGAALAIQQRFHEEVKQKKYPGVFLKVEHPDVFTLGKSATEDHFLLPMVDENVDGTPVFRIDRGGEVTAHMAGQLVVYPILSFQGKNLTPKKYVGLLEDSVIDVLRSFDVEGYCDEAFPGVWVQGKKICAIGVRIKEKVTMHGIALNVINDLTLFRKIVPCGIKGREVCRLADLIRGPVDVANTWNRLLKAFETRLGPIAPLGLVL